jgi:hypothetical protein
MYPIVELLKKSTAAPDVPGYEELVRIIRKLDAAKTSFLIE